MIARAPTKHRPAGHERAMRWPASPPLLGAVVMQLTGCGARTGFDVDTVPTAPSATGTNTSPAIPGAQGTEDGVFCAFNAGPVSSCDAPAADGPVQRCSPRSRHCLNIAGQWGCCSGDSNNDGSGGVCYFPMFGSVCN
jgi:hypothetical protein